MKQYIVHSFNIIYFNQLAQSLNIWHKNLIAFFRSTSSRITFQFDSIQFGFLQKKEEEEEERPIEIILTHYNLHTKYINKK